MSRKKRAARRRQHRDSGLPKFIDSCSRCGVATQHTTLYAEPSARGTDVEVRCDECGLTTQFVDA